MNLDAKTVAGFGAEWTSFPQDRIDHDELARAFESYFHIFPWRVLPSDGGCGADIGCGSGRWAALVAPRVRVLHLVDASAAALEVARNALEGATNVEFHHADIEAMPIDDGTLDFAYALGVLHHVPNPGAALRAIVARLKPGAPLLVYIYYAFDNRPWWYRGLWRLSDSIRKIVARMPFGVRLFLSGIVAGAIYFPLARSAKLLAGAAIMPRNWPLAFYRDRSFYTMRTDALDRFGTRLESRFTREETEALLRQAGLEDLFFSESAPYWCAVGFKSEQSRQT